MGYRHKKGAEYKRQHWRTTVVQPAFWRCSMHTMPTERSALRKPFYRQLYFQVVFAIIVGVLLGHFEPPTARP
jgi:aerobic C4-dicarboxylate transport protein